MIIKVFNKFEKNKIRPLILIGTLDQDTIAKFYYCKLKFIRQAQLTSKQVIEEGKIRINNIVFQTVNTNMSTNKKQCYAIQPN